MLTVSLPLSLDIQHLLVLGCVLATHKLSSQTLNTHPPGHCVRIAFGRSRCLGYVRSARESHQDHRQTSAIDFRGNSLATSVNCNALKSGRTQVLQGIRLIKSYGWEAFFAQRISELRGQEVKAIRKSAYVACPSCSPLPRRLEHMVQCRAGWPVQSLRKHTRPLRCRVFCGFSPPFYTLRTES